MWLSLNFNSKTKFSLQQKNTERENMMCCNARKQEELY